LLAANGGIILYNLLLVDDTDILRHDVKRLDVWGETSGFQITGEADNGEAAVELLKSGRFDLIITDIKMPVMDGIELLEAVKSDGLCPCVVFLSEYSDFSFAKKGIILGAFDYLVKPVNREELLSMLGRVSAFLDAAFREREERLREK
jgi:two-component system, response regulator YesN